VLATLALVALNLRIALSSVPAVESSIADATGWSAAVIGALTQLPVLCMGAFALLVPRIAGRIGRRPTVALALALITVALVMRLAALVPGVLHLSALVAGIGIALAGGLVPSIVREQLPGAVGWATGLWTAAMMAGAALGGALTAPLAEATSWQVALALWAIPAALALAVWWLVEDRADPAPDADAPRANVRLADLPWRDRRAWSLTLYLLLNSVVFYTCLAWLAPSYVDRGLTENAAGVLFGLFTGAQIAGALVMPRMAERLPGPRVLYAASLAVVAVTLVLIGWLPELAPAVVVSAFGAVLGGGFAMGLALLSQWAGDASASARLTAMAFSVTYLTASFGPLLAGVMLDAYDSWPMVFGVLVLVTLIQFATIPALRRGVRIA
jgi:CP family cyanate transporter-like MFS transporter